VRDAGQDVASLVFGYRCGQIAHVREQMPVRCVLSTPVPLTLGKRRCA
jgi:hypothetical protein